MLSPETERVVSRERKNEATHRLTDRRRRGHVHIQGERAALYQRRKALENPKKFDVLKTQKISFKKGRRLGEKSQRRQQGPRRRGHKAEKLTVPSVRRQLVEANILGEKQEE